MGINSIKELIQIPIVSHKKFEVASSNLKNYIFATKYSNAYLKFIFDQVCSGY